jgi:hypothetical protein
VEKTLLIPVDLLCHLLDIPGSVAELLATRRRLAELRSRFALRSRRWTERVIPFRSRWE